MQSLADVADHALLALGRPERAFPGHGLDAPHARPRRCSRPQSAPAQYPRWRARACPRTVRAKTRPPGPCGPNRRIFPRTRPWPRAPWPLPASFPDLHRQVLQYFSIHDFFDPVQFRTAHAWKCVKSNGTRRAGPRSPTAPHAAQTWRKAACRRCVAVWLRAMAAVRWPSTAATTFAPAELSLQHLARLQDQTLWVFCTSRDLHGSPRFGQFAVIPHLAALFSVKRRLVEHNRNLFPGPASARLVLLRRLEPLRPGRSFRYPLKPWRPVCDQFRIAGEARVAAPVPGRTGPACFSMAFWKPAFVHRQFLLQAISWVMSRGNRRCRKAEGSRPANGDFRSFSGPRSFPSNASPVQGLVEPLLLATDHGGYALPGRKPPGTRPHDLPTSRIKFDRKGSSKPSSFPCRMARLRMRRRT